MKKHLFLTALLFSASASFAQITPSGDSYGPLNAANFGGTGIPNQDVVQTTVNGVTLGLTATQRFSNPVVTDNNAGTFFAAAGIDTNPPSPADPYARWNFDFYIGHVVQPGGTTTDMTGVAAYNYKLFYDFDPAVGNAQATHGSISFVGALLSNSQTISFGGVSVANPNYSQGSLNLGMNFLQSGSVISGTPIVSAPSGIFNPNALGQYSFKLTAYTQTGSLFGGNLNLYGTEQFSTSMVVSAIPEPGEWAMMLAGLGVVSMIARRRRKVTA